MLGILIGPAVIAGDWTQFRGPAGTGVAEGAAVPVEWSAESGVAWTAKVPGAGWAQPVVVGDKVFVATAVSDPPFVPKNMMAGVADPKSRPDPKAKGPAPGPDVKIDWQVLRLDLKTGKTEWARTVASGKPRYAIHPSNTFATETPAADAERVYVSFGAAGVLAALDHAGNEVWRKDLGAYPTMGDLGPGASPALHAGKLYVPLFNEEKGALVCLDAGTGAQKWKADRKPGTSWATPFVWVNAVRTEVVACGKGMVTSHDPDTGNELWRLEGIDSSFSASPAAGKDVIVFGNGGPGSVSPLFGVKAGAAGDITLKKGEKSNDWVLFYKPGAAPGMASPVVVGGYAYVWNTGGLACYELKSGKEVYKERLPKARMIAAAPVAANGHLYFLDEAGLAAVVKAGPQFEVVATSKLDDTFWASPAVAGDRLLLRGVNALYCVKK